MKTVRMTDRWVRTILVERGREEYSDALVRGLRLRISPASRKWSVVTKRGGKQVRKPIGEFPDVSLADARERANKLLEAMSVNAAAGVAPPTTDEVFPLLETLCGDYVEQMKAKGQGAHDAYDRALVRSEASFCKFMEKKLGRPARAADVKQEHAVEWLREVFQRSPAHSRHCRAYLHAAFAWALKSNLDFTSVSGGKDYGVSVNPVAGTPTGPKATPRQRVLSKKELRAIWETLPDAADPRTAAAIRLIIAMGGLRISEISGSKKEWYKDGWLCLPTTKNKREHHVPLTAHATEQYKIALACANSKSEYLFPNVYDIRKPIELTSLGKVARRLMSDFDLPPFQLKDLRRTFKTHLLDGEYVEEREIDIWHNHGQHSDVARKHYTWAEYKSVKIRVAKKIDDFLDRVFHIQAGVSANPPFAE